MPPPAWKSSMKKLPAGLRLSSTGTARPMRSNSSRSKAIPARPAMAARWTSALVEPLVACNTTEALRSAALAMLWRGGGRAARQREAERVGDRRHGGGGAHHHAGAGGRHQLIMGAAELDLVERAGPAGRPQATAIRAGAAPSAFVAARADPAPP